MKYEKGVCLAFNVRDKGFLAGFVVSAEYGKYQIVLFDYCKSTAPDKTYFISGMVFGVQYQMAEKPLWALDLLNLDQAQIDEATGITQVMQIPVPGLINASGFTELPYSPETLLDYFEKTKLARIEGTQNDDQRSPLLEKKCMRSLMEFLAGMPGPNELPTVKLYLEKEGAIHYWQVYGNSKEPLALVVHWGKLGETGEFVETLDKTLADIKAIYQSGINAKRAEGYSEWTNPAEMILQFATSDSWGNTEDLDFRNAMSDHLDRYLFWTGNGATSGGDIGSGTVNLFFEAVSPEIAVSTIVQALQEKKVEQAYLIALQTYPESNDLSDGEQIIKVLYPADFNSEFFY